MSETVQDILKICSKLNESAEQIIIAEMFDEREKNQDPEKTRLCKRALEIIDETPNIPENVRCIFIDWREHLFSLVNVNANNYKHYLNDGWALYKIWGIAASIKLYVVDAAVKNREITLEEKQELGRLFAEAKIAAYANELIGEKQAHAITTMSENLDLLIEIYRKMIKTEN